MDWVLQLTLFLGCLVLTERRIAASRYDFLCCWKRSPSATLAAAGRRVTVTETDGRQSSSFRTTFPTAPQGSMREATTAALAAGESGGIVVRAATARAMHAVIPPPQPSAGLSPCGWCARGCRLPGTSQEQAGSRQPVSSWPATSWPDDERTCISHVAPRVRVDAAVAES